MRVQKIGGADLQEWQYFVDSCPSAGAMHHAGWYGVLEESSSVQRHFLAVREGGGRIAGVLPLYFSRSPFTGSHLTSLEDGILAETSEAALALAEAALALRSELSAGYLVMRGGALPGAPPTHTHDTVRRIIDTSGTSEEVFARLSSYVRRDIRRAGKNGFSIEDDPQLDSLDGFFDEYAAHMRYLGTPVMTRRFMSAMKRHLGPERLRLFVIRHQGELVGGLLCVTSQNTWTALYAVVRQSLLGGYGNYLLYWHAIERVIAAGIKRFDLGRNNPGSGVHQFKAKWPGEDLMVPYSYFAAPDMKRDFGMSDMREGRSLKQRMWMRLPLPVTNILGPMLRAQLPFG